MLDDLLFCCSSEELEGLIYLLVVTGVLAISLLLVMVEIPGDVWASVVLDNLLFC